MWTESAAGDHFQEVCLWRRSAWMLTGMLWCIQLLCRKLRNQNLAYISLVEIYSPLFLNARLCSFKTACFDNQMLEWYVLIICTQADFSKRHVKLFYQQTKPCYWTPGPTVAHLWPFSSCFTAVHLSVIANIEYKPDKLPTGILGKVSF